jgi:hypothetical protein
MDMKVECSRPVDPRNDVCLFALLVYIIQGHADLQNLQELQDIRNMVPGDIERNYVTENFCLRKDNS